MVPLNQLIPNETKSFELDLLKSLKPDDSKTRKQRGQLLVELTFNPFKEDTERQGGAMDGINRLESRTGDVSQRLNSLGAGLLLIVVQAAEDVEGKKHNNPYALVLFRGEQRKTKVINTL